jgi:exosortase
MNHTTAAPIANAGPIEREGLGVSRAWVVHAIWIVPAMLVFAPTIYWLWQRWTMSVWHNVHGIFIPFVVAYFVHDVLRSDPIVESEQSAWGFLFLVSGLGMIVLDSAIQTQLLSAFGMVVCLPGLSLLLLGGRRTKVLTFAWILAFFMLPIPAAFIERFTLLLRTIAAVGTERLIALFAMPVVREDTLLLLPGTRFAIVDACSGFSVLYASVTMALVLAYINPSWPRRVATLAAVFPIAMACNILRCTFLALIVNRWGGRILDTFLHPLSGLLTFGVAAILLTFLGTTPEMRGSAA